MEKLLNQKIMVYIEDYTFLYDHNHTASVQRYQTGDLINHI